MHGKTNKTKRNLYDGQLHSSFNYIFPENGAQHVGYNEQALGSVFLQLLYAITFGTLPRVSLRPRNKTIVKLAFILFRIKTADMWIQI